jgi:hypothetical protein
LTIDEKQLTKIGVHLLCQRADEKVFISNAKVDYSRPLRNLCAGTKRLPFRQKFLKRLSGRLFITGQNCFISGRLNQSGFTKKFEILSKTWLSVWQTI